MSALETVGSLIRGYNAARNLYDLFSDSAVKQSRMLQDQNLIDHNRKLKPGFTDAGRSTKIGDRGEVLGEAAREIVVFLSPTDDPHLKEAMERFRKIDDPSTSIEARVEALAIFVAKSLPRERGSASRSDGDVTFDGFPKRANVSLGSLIVAGTGAPRHKALMMKVLADDVGLPMAMARGYLSVAGRPQTHEWNHFLGSEGDLIIVDASTQGMSQNNSLEFSNYLA